MPRVWFVTGSSKGFGHAIVKAVLEKGESVVATARNPSTLDALVEAYGSTRILALPLDVSSHQQALDAVRLAVEHFGRIDVLVNNAGTGGLSAVEDISIKAFRDLVDINFFGVVNVTKAALPIMRAQGHGRIIQVSSIGARLATPGCSAYQASKAAVVTFSSALNNEVAPLGIRVTTCEPGAMPTDIWEHTKMKEMGEGGGSSHRISEPYLQTVGQMLAVIDGYAAKAPMVEDKERGISVELPVSSVEGMARGILALSELEDPPLRLLMGADAYEMARGLEGQLAASDEKWRALSMLQV